MTVRCKFKCVETGEQIWGNPGKVARARFQVVYEGSPENKEFFASTPSGQIDVATIKTGIFEVGKEYYVDFTEVG